MARARRLSRAVLRPRTLVDRFVPPLALMGLIFFLSAQPDLNSGLGVVDFVGRKLIHAAEFGLLFFLWLRAFRFRARGALPAAAIAVLYAAGDEWHQASVNGRTGHPLDVLVDVAGIAVAWALWRRARHRHELRRARHAAAAGSDPAALGGDEDGLGAVDRAELAVDVVQVGADGARRE